MAIPYDILVNWARPGKSENSKITYNVLKNIIENKTEPNTEIFLQGSYHNTTHVKENSDIDIVVINPKIVINNTIYGLNGPLYQLQNWKNVLYNSINGTQNFSFTKGNKTIKYKGNLNYVPTDIVPCGYYKGSTIGSEIGTILFDSNKGKYFINYPRQHYDNGTIKSEQTNGNYKKTVRMFKNARNNAVKKHLLESEDIAPSYFLECLIYNIPNTYFNGNESEMFFKTLKWLYDNRSNLSNLKCQNKIQNLFGYDISNLTYNKWNTADAIKFINAIVKLWNDWSSL